MKITAPLIANLTKTLDIVEYDYFLERKEDKNGIKYIANEPAFATYNKERIEKENIKRYTLTEMLGEYEGYLNGNIHKPVDITFYNSNFCKTVAKTCAKQPLTSDQWNKIFNTTLKNICEDWLLTIVKAAIGKKPDVSSKMICFSALEQAYDTKDFGMPSQLKNREQRLIDVISCLEKLEYEPQDYPHLVQFFSKHKSILDYPEKGSPVYLKEFLKKCIPSEEWEQFSYVISRHEEKVDSPTDFSVFTSVENPITSFIINKKAIIRQHPDLRLGNDCQEMLMTMMELFNKHGEEAGVGSHNSYQVLKENNRILVHFMSRDTQQPNQEFLQNVASNFFQLYEQGLLTKEIKNNDYLKSGFIACILDAKLPKKPANTKKNKI